MKVVIDTNVFLVIIPSLSPYHQAYKALKENRYDLMVSNEILLEYEEQLSLRYHISGVSEILENLLENQNIHLYNPEYKWNLISQDADDNKFVDCAIASNSDWIVTNDKHFHPQPWFVAHETFPCLIPAHKRFLFNFKSGL